MQPAALSRLSSRLLSHSVKREAFIPYPAAAAGWTFSLTQRSSDGAAVADSSRVLLEIDLAAGLVPKHVEDAVVIFVVIVDTGHGHDFDTVSLLQDPLHRIVGRVLVDVLFAGVGDAGIGEALEGEDTDPLILHGHLSDRLFDVLLLEATCIRDKVVLVIVPLGRAIRKELKDIQTQRRSRACIPSRATR